MSDPAIEVAVVEQAIEVAVVEQTVAVELVESVIAVEMSGPAGPAGAAGVGAALEVPFAYGDATPKLLTTAAAGKFIYEVDVIITTAFNGVGAALILGDAAIPNRLMASTENDPSTLGTYTTHPNVAYLVSTVVNLTITPGGGATQGVGIVRLLIQQ